MDSSRTIDNVKAISCAASVRRPADLTEALTGKTITLDIVLDVGSSDNIGNVQGTIRNKAMPQPLADG